MTAEGTRIDDVVVVGGGDNGVLAALLLQRLNQGMDITVVDDFDEEMPELGKATYANVQGLFHELLDIDRDRFFSEVRPVCKLSILFEDWCGADSFHVPFDDAGPSPQLFPDEQGEEMYHRYQTGDHGTLGTALAEAGKSPFQTVVGDNWRLFDHHAYHLSIGRFNEFLRTLCGERGVSLVNDRITDVETADGRIESISGASSTYEADLYLDATGFSRLLMGHLDNEFVTFDNPLDSAVVTKVQRDVADIVPSTVVTTGDHGWMWQIDTLDFRDLGYVYASEYASEEEAVAEFVAAHDGAFDESDVAHFEFESGYLERPWVGNCVAVGNALGFVEPLQSVTLSLSADLAKNLSELISKHARLNYPGIRSLYNARTVESWRELRSFISLHYIYSDGDTEFWRAVQDLEPNDRLQEYVESYRNHGFHAYREFHEDVTGPSDAWIHYLLLDNLGVESEFYERRDIEVRPKVKERHEQQRTEQATAASRHMSYEEVVAMGVYD